MKSSRHLWWCCIKDFPHGLAANSKKKLYQSMCAMNVLASPCPFCALYLLEDDWDFKQLESWNWISSLQIAFGLGFPKEHEVRGQPASTKHQEVLSHAWFCSSFRATQNFGLREMVHSVAGAVGWVWDRDPGPLYHFSRGLCRTVDFFVFCSSLKRS